MKKRIVTAVITTCLALCAAVWPQPDTREERPAPIPTHAVTAPKADAATRAEKKKYGNAAGRAGRGAWHRSCSRTGRVNACGRNAAARAYASHTTADHRTAARRRGLYSGLWLGTIRGAESPRVCRGYVRKWQ